jgi:hypothetical protein
MRTIQVSALLSLLLGSWAAQAGTPVINVTVGGEISPGVYGEVQIGNAPPPPVVYAQPVIIQHEHHDEGRPIYLHVPPGHAKNWARHCREYNACNRPVYFVKSAEYEPGYREHGRGHGHGKHGDEGRGDEGRRNDGGGDWRGNEGRGEGNGNEGRRGRGHDRD